MKPRGRAHFSERLSSTSVPLSIPKSLLLSYEGCWGWTIVTMLIVDIKTHLVAGGIVLLLPIVQLVHASLLQLLLQPRALRLHPWECQALDISTLPVSLLTLQLQGGAVLLLLHPGQPVHQPADDSHHPLPSSLVHVHRLQHAGHRDHVLWDLTRRPLHLFDRIVGLALSLLRVLTWV